MSGVSASSAAFWSTKLISFAIALQTIELIQTKAAILQVWDWSILKKEFEIFPIPVRWLLSSCLEGRRFLWLLCARLVAALVVLLLPLAWMSPVWIGFLFLSTLAIALRWRGTYNGGSDYMTLIVTSGLSVAAMFSAHSRIVHGCLGYIALQSCASYWIAGLVKIKSRAWRSGRALASFLATPGYDSPEWARWLVGQRLRAFGLAWGVIGFECLFPCVFFGPRACLVFVAAAALFHLGNVYVLGLNRFVWAWAASYPALFWLVGRVG